MEVEQEGSDQQEIREENQEPSEVETQPEAVEDAEKKEDITPEQSDIPATNFHITDDELGQGTPKEKFRANIMAIQLLKEMRGRKPQCHTRRTGDFIPICRLGRSC